MIDNNSAFDIQDLAHAWVDHGKFVLPGAATGPLKGLTFAVKDVFDVQGYPNGFGNPVWLQTHEAAKSTSSVVQMLLDAGATLCGKVLTDELTYSLNGDNIHYGTPLNLRAPGRVPGGSSSGSAAAVAAGSVDFALGTDTGGSTRVPASYCGIWGLRTTHGLVNRDGVVPLQPSFDTVTWLARFSDVFVRVGEVLLPRSEHQFMRVLHLDEPWQLADEAAQACLFEVEDALQRVLGVKSCKQELLTTGQSLEHWRHEYQIASAHEAWVTHGQWITEHSPVLGEPIAKRFQFASTVSDTQARQAWLNLAQIKERVHGLVGGDAVVVVPSSASTALSLDACPQYVDDARMRTMRITCVAGIAGLPQVSIPMTTSQGEPFGVSLMGPAGSDLALIELSVQVARRLGLT